MKTYYTRNLSLLLLSLAALSPAAFGAQMSITNSAEKPTENVILGIPSVNGGATSVIYWGESRTGNVQQGQSFSLAQSMNLQSAVFQISYNTKNPIGTAIPETWNASGAAVTLTLYKLSETKDADVYVPISEVASYTANLPTTGMLRGDFLYFNLEDPITLIENVQYSLVLSFVVRASDRQISLATAGASSYTDGRGVIHRNNSEWELRSDNVSLHLQGTNIPESGTTALLIGGSSLALVFALRHQMRRRASRG